jgi:dCMP deaminase
VKIIPMDDRTRTFLRLAYTYAASNSDDQETKNGAVLVCGGEVEVFGANRFPDGVAVTPERLQRPEKYEYIIHAEQDAIIQAAKNGIATQGLEMFCPWVPCTKCAQLIIQAGIKRVVAHKRAHDKTNERWTASIDKAVAMLEEAGVEYVRADGEIGGVAHLFAGEWWKP